MSRRRVTTFVVHLNAAQAQAMAARERRDTGIGCLVVLGFFAVVAAITFWYVTVPVVAVLVAAGTLRRRHVVAGRRARGAPRSAVTRPAWRPDSTPRPAAPERRCAYCNALILDTRARATCANCSAPL